MGWLSPKTVRSSHYRTHDNPTGHFTKPPRVSMGRWTIEKLKRAAAAAGRKLIVDPVTGRIDNASAVKKVRAYRDNLRANGKACPQCGVAVSRKGFFCRRCAPGVAASYSGMDEGDLDSLYDAEGRNRNGIRYRGDGTRIFPHDSDW